jgi:rod shape-determining protein MreD
MRRAIVCAALACVAVVVQIVLVDRLPLPGGSRPDIALVLVVVFGLTQGPLTGMLTGFFGGLALDLTPPASHLIGESALVFCVVGYACGVLSGWLDHFAPRLVAALIGAGTGEAAVAAAGMIAGDPGVTLAAVRHVLPAAVLYDSLLCPVVLFFAVLASRRLAVRIGSGHLRSQPRVCRRVPRWPRGRVAAHSGLGRTGHAARTGGLR